MSVAGLKVYLDNAAADTSQLDLFREVRVDQAIGLATEAELKMDVGLDTGGSWSGIDEDFAQPGRRVRIEVRASDGQYIALIDGPIVAQHFDLSSEANSSTATLIVHDDSALMNQTEEVALFEEQTADAIAGQLFSAHGLAVEVDPVTAVTGGLARVVVQRGTAMQLLRELARRHGRFLYVSPGDAPGTSTGHFVTPDLSETDLPELLGVGADRNVNKLTLHFDGLRPMSATASGVRITDRTVLSAEVSKSGLAALGAVPAHQIASPGSLRMARTREEDGDLADATQAAVDHSSWAYAGEGEVRIDAYGAVLTPHRVVRVAGAGSYLGGEYLIARVTHTLNDEGYTQRFSLQRNARSDGDSGASVPGGLF